MLLLCIPKRWKRIDGVGGQEETEERAADGTMKLG
jgi:hypothetical protein